MKIILFLLFSFPAFAFAEAETEAGSSCIGKECLNLEGVSSKEVKDLCLKSLPEHCQTGGWISGKKIPDHYSICSPNEDSSAKGFSETLNCLKGLAYGILLEPSLFVMEGSQFLWDFLTDEEAREESLNALNFLAEEIAGPEGDEVLKDILLSPAVEAKDRYLQCLNTEGRWEYICRRGGQVLTGVTAFHFFRKWRKNRSLKKDLSKYGMNKADEEFLDRYYINNDTIDPKTRRYKPGIPKTGRQSMRETLNRALVLETDVPPATEDLFRKFAKNNKKAREKMAYLKKRGWTEDEVNRSIILRNFLYADYTDSASLAYGNLVNIADEYNIFDIKVLKEMRKLLDKDSDVASRARMQRNFRWRGDDSKDYFNLSHRPEDMKKIIEKHKDTPGLKTSYKEGPWNNIPPDDWDKVIR